MQQSWADREQIILEAVAQAREDGTDLPKAAREAVPALANHQNPKLYGEVIANLEQAGYLDVAIMRSGDGNIAGLHIRRINERGLRAAGVWPTDDPFGNLVAVLERAIENERNTEAKSRLVKLRDALLDLGKSMGTTLAVEYGKRLLGL